MKFLISPGLPRSGTTYLHHQLVVVNEGVFNAPREKETNIFWSGMPLQQALNDKFLTRDPDRFFLDFSPSYLAGPPGAVERIAALARSHEVKIVLHLRNPVEQAYAHYLHDIAAHASRLEFDGNPDFSFWTGSVLDRYLVPRSRLVRRIVDAVGRSNVFVVNFHRDIPDPARLAPALSNFLDLDLEPFTSAKIGVGGWLPHYLCANDAPIALTRGTEVRELPPRQVLLVGREFSHLWKNVDAGFAERLLHGQATWTKRLEPVQIQTLWQSFFAADFTEIADILGEDPSDYPLPDELSASDTALGSTEFQWLEPAGGIADLIEERSNRLRAAPDIKASGDTMANPSDVGAGVTAEQIAACYRVFFGRQPESAEVVADHLRRHATLESFLTQVAKAPEFVWTAQRVLASFSDNPRLGGHVDVGGDADQMDRLIAHTRSVWAKYGENDAYYSVLTADKFRAANMGGKTVDEFYATGEADTRRILGCWAKNDRTPNPEGTILDLGCGLGRVGEHLSKHFAGYVGVDISKPHLDQAERRFNDIGRTNGRFRLLQEFVDSDETVDAVISVIVLQHNPPPVIAMLIDRMCKALRPGGLLYFQVPVAIVDYAFDIERYLSNLPAHGIMEMHCVPQREVYRILAENSCRVLESHPDGRIGNIGLSYTFAAYKA